VKRLYHWKKLDKVLFILSLRGGNGRLCHSEKRQRRRNLCGVQKIASPRQVGSRDEISLFVIANEVKQSHALGIRRIPRCEATLHLQPNFYIYF